MLWKGRAFALLGALGFGTVLSACASEASETAEPVTELRSESGQAQVVVAWPTPVQRGQNTFVVQMASNDASLRGVTAFMPAHGHGTEGIRVVSASSGEYRVDDLALYMPGRWEVTLLLDTATGADRVRFGVSVP